MVVKPRALVRLPFIRAPTTCMLFVSNIIRSSNGGTEKPCTTPRPNQRVHQVETQKAQTHC